MNIITVKKFYFLLEILKLLFGINLVRNLDSDHKIFTTRIHYHVKYSYEERTRKNLTIYDSLYW